MKRLAFYFKYVFSITPLVVVIVAELVTTGNINIFGLSLALSMFALFNTGQTLFQLIQEISQSETLSLDTPGMPMSVAGLTVLILVMGLTAGLSIVQSLMLINILLAFMSIFVDFGISQAFRLWEETDSQKNISTLKRVYNNFKKRALQMLKTRDQRIEELEETLKLRDAEVNYWAAEALAEKAQKEILEEQMAVENLKLPDYNTEDIDKTVSSHLHSAILTEREKQEKRMRGK